MPPRCLAPEGRSGRDRSLSALGDSFFFGILPAPGGRARITGIATFSIAYLLLWWPATSWSPCTCFHPAFSPTPVASELFLRLTYLAGWTLLLLAVQTPTTCST